MNCLNCNKETLNPKYCNRSCAAVHTNKLFPRRKRTTKCHIEGCSCLTLSYRHRKCKAHWQEYQASKLDNQTLGAVIYTEHHKSSAFAKVRTRARSKLPPCPCSKCGYEKHTEVCHIKPIKDFSMDTLLSEINALSNLVRLCPNCHWELDHT